MKRYGLAMTMVPLLWLAGCSSGGSAADPVVTNEAASLDATADELDRMANELENGAR